MDDQYPIVIEEAGRLAQDKNGILYVLKNVKHRHGAEGFCDLEIFDQRVVHLRAWEALAGFIKMPA
jgi:hypothetical protein